MREGNRNAQRRKSGVGADLAIRIILRVADEHALAVAAYSAIPFAAPLYARIDMIRDDRGDPVILELEMTEPSVFLLHAPGSADRFARAVLSRLINIESRER